MLDGNGHENETALPVKFQPAQQAKLILSWDGSLKSGILRTARLIRVSQTCLKIKSFMHFGRRVAYMSATLSIGQIGWTLSK